MTIMDPELRDQQVRTRAFRFFAEQTALHGDTLPWSVLSEQFEVEGQRVPLIGQTVVGSDNVSTIWKSSRESDEPSPRDRRVIRTKRMDRRVAVAAGRRASSRYQS
jgi:hypothetical protein